MRVIYLILSIIFLGNVSIAQDMRSLPVIEKIFLEKSNNQVVFSSNHNLDKVIIKFQLPKQGSSSVPKGKAGILSIAQDLFLKGTKNKDARKIGEELILANSDIFFSYNADDVFIYVSANKSSLNNVLNMLEDILNNHAVKDNVFNMSKEDKKTSILESKSRPGFIAAKEIDKIIFPNHPYSHEVNKETLDNIKLADVTDKIKSLNFYKAKISVAGNVNKEEIKSNLQNFLDRVNSKEYRINKYEKIKITNDRKIHTVNFDSPQTLVKYVQILNLEQDKLTKVQILKQILLGQILNQPFTGILSKKFRSELGYTYNIRSEINMLEPISLFEVSFSTDNNNVNHSLTTLEDMMNDLSKHVSEEDFNKAKKSILYKEYRDLDSLSTLHNKLSYINKNDLPETFLNDFEKDLKAISLEDFKNFIAEIFSKEYLFLLVGKNNN